MYSVEVCDMQPDDEYFVATCAHTNESEEIDASAERRLAWLKEMYGKGLRVKVARAEGKPVGKASVMPIEIYPWGLSGRDILVMPCIWVPPPYQRKGIGRALMAEAVAEANWQGKKALAIQCYEGHCWFMPAAFFAKQEFSAIKKRGQEVLLWRPLHPYAEPPDFMERQYAFRPVADKVVVDLFWNSFCLTSVSEYQRVRQIVEEFGDKVVLNEYPADDRKILMQYQIPRAIMVNGRELGWGYVAPREGVRKAIREALEAIQPF
ncbi:MAG: GNAT family N-acetyltransferase [Candidatus Zixiibacteriota bacterium]|nr:MAG: GNAT family N-acetyltransferase [candidate division Zixibacteria bacterium]